MDRTEVIDSILRLNNAEKHLDQKVRDELRLVRERLEDALGETVRPAEAARLLGVSQPALKRWLDRGDIATVITPRGKREIPFGEVVSLIAETEEARRAGRERALSAVIKRRWQRAETDAQFQRLMNRKPGRTHRSPERISLAYHRLVAERLTSEMIEAARARLARWERAGRIDPRWAAEWHELLSQPSARIAKTIASSSARATQLRQTSPFAGTLTEQERRSLLASAN